MSSGELSGKTVVRPGHSSHRYTASTFQWRIAGAVHAHEVFEPLAVAAIVGVGFDLSQRLANCIRHDYSLGASTQARSELPPELVTTETANSPG